MARNVFKPGVRVRFNIPDGALAEIVRYAQEGYYLIRTIPDQRELMASEDDLVLAGNTETKA